MLFWGLTLGVIGKVLIAVGILRVHYVMALEHRIDEKVISSFALEKTFTIIGIFLLFLGYFLEMYFYGLTPMLTCEVGECAAAIGAAFPGV
jgi:hypothetical protein